jgi:hypothetical protein
LLQLFVLDARAGMHEATAFSVPAGSPDEYMQAGAAFARELDPNVEISYWDLQSGSLSVSRVEGDRVKCILRASPDIGEALKPLGPFLNGRIEPRAQARFALAHEVGHCKLRDAFLRLLSSAMYRDPNHATGHYVSDAPALCHHNRDDSDAVQCAIATAYYTVGGLADDQYKAQFCGADLSRFAFNEVSRHGNSRYITVAGSQHTDATYGLADYYGFKTGELVTDDKRKRHRAAYRRCG